jgi:hypothetical protein
MVGMPHATSTFSMARVSSPSDSDRILPFSMVMVRPISCVSRSSSAFSLNRY